VLTIAHRGASGYAPENTRAAFDLGIEMGADMIESDVQVSRDGQIVLFHDDLVNRTSDGSGPVADHTLAELRALDLGRWFAPAFAGERILTLDEFAREYVPRIPVCLEIKDPLAVHPLMDEIGTWDETSSMHVTSFSWTALLHATACIPDLTCGYLSKTFDGDIIRRCVERGIAQICPPARMLDRTLVDEAHASGLMVRAWGIRDRSDVDLLFASGADGATINWPDWILERRSVPGVGAEVSP
jgi:glycerophosphoryl diester phosphodiesterase